MLRSLTFFALIFAFLPQSARADAIRITDGSLSESTSSIADFVLIGEGFRLSGDVTGSSGLLQQCIVCRPGGQFSLAGWWEFEGQAEQNGTTVPVSGRLTFHAGNVAIPDLPENQDARLTRAFAFVARISGLESASNGSLQLVGHGSATVRFFRHEGEGVLPTLIRYDFSENTPTQPTPEPATLALVGSGVAGALFARRRKRFNS